MPVPFPTDSIPEERRRGRGAGNNPANRFDRLQTQAAADGWDIAEDLPPVRTEVTVDQSRSIIARNSSPDIPFDRSINPYRGCEHGCIYCYARPSHAQLGLSPGLDFETRLVVKPQAAELLGQALAARSYRVAPIAIGTNTDPYQPIEKTHRIMARLLDVLWQHRHPVTVTTKGVLVMRDAGILGRLGRAGLAHVAISLTTLDNRLSRAMEPRAAAPARRLDMVRALAAERVPVGVNIAPIIPALNDHEIERLMDAAAAAGASFASYTTLRLPLEVSPLFRDWLAREYPDRAARVMGMVREMHGGRDYDPQWGTRMRAGGVHGTLIRRRFQLARKRAGLDRPAPALRSDLFRPPPRLGDQLSLGI